MTEDTTAPTERVTFEVNGQPIQWRGPLDRRLIDVLRDDLGLTGTKEGCGTGVCGACSVLVDGQLRSACLTFAVLVGGAAIRTVEGLASTDGVLSPLQRAFIERGGFQCGFCTPGQLMAATALLAEQPFPTTDDVRRWMAGNLCRCTGYYKIAEAILAAADEPGAGGGGDGRQRPVDPPGAGPAG